MNELKRLMGGLLGGKSAPRQSQSHWEIHWDDGSVTQVYRRGKHWMWGCHGSSHLDGIRDQLEGYREAGYLSGQLVRVKNQ